MKLGQGNPENIRDEQHLEDLLSEPTSAAVAAMSRLQGDIILLGVAGKMGPTLARMAARASSMAGVSRKIIGVSRFSKDEGDKLQMQLSEFGIQSLRCDLLDADQLSKLPDVPNVIYMPAMKFGSTNQEGLTWAMNTFLPGMVCQKFRKSKIVAFSTGNIYGLSPIALGGSRECDTPNPTGDYAMSCLGRERMFDHFSRTFNIPVSIIRLNYATEMRYGVLVDLARKVWEQKPIDLSMGALNAIWQADANAMTLASFDAAQSPPFILNVTGPELLSVRVIAATFARMMNRPLTFTGAESADAFLSNGALGHHLYSYPRVPVMTLQHWIADWVSRGGSSLNKPTHFEARDGKY
jgi:nucleoside-diphosphate-sugar epimerase